MRRVVCFLSATSSTFNAFCYGIIQGSVNLVRDATCWQCEHEWRQDVAVITKWLSGMSPRITAKVALNHEWFSAVSLPKSKDFMPTFPAQHAQNRNSCIKNQ
ncbi:uncharacterized protein LOC131231556 isoform X2 [Magnolia sinica]|uniref:uncharacterized protein LOC131231556 isoform X2 n=1 Tax=Magnolia sinica TaxID=86752 RepID=UPI002659D814|nr:uncharacterized protein LOC131231556 isoform X2 [Magnolia sinica]